VGAEASRARHAEATDHARRQPGQLEGRVRVRVRGRARVRVWDEGRGWKELAPNRNHHPNP